MRSRCRRWSCGLRRNTVHVTKWPYGATNKVNDNPVRFSIQWNPSGKARNVSLKLQNLVHFRAPFLTNHVYFTPHDRPPLLKGQHHGWPLSRGSTVFTNLDVFVWLGSPKHDLLYLLKNAIQQLCTYWYVLSSFLVQYYFLWIVLYY